MGGWLDALGERGTFARDAWPLLALCALVASVALLSLSAPLFRLLATLGRALRKAQERSAARRSRGGERGRRIEGVAKQ